MGNASLRKPYAQMPISSLDFPANHLTLHSILVKGYAPGFVLVAEDAELKKTNT